LVRKIFFATNAIVLGHRPDGFFHAEYFAPLKK